jgi:hypothetical protein
LEEKTDRDITRIAQDGNIGVYGASSPRQACHFGKMQTTVEGAAPRQYENFASEACIVSSVALEARSLVRPILHLENWSLQFNHLFTDIRHT